MSSPTVARRGCSVFPAATDFARTGLGCVGEANRLFFAPRSGATKRCHGESPRDAARSPLWDHQGGSASQFRGVPVARAKTAAYGARDFRIPRRSESGHLPLNASLDTGSFGRPTAFPILCPRNSEVFPQPGSCDTLSYAAGRELDNRNEVAPGAFVFDGAYPDRAIR